MGIPEHPRDRRPRAKRIENTRSKAMPSWVTAKKEKKPLLPPRKEKYFKQRADRAQMQQPYGRPEKSPAPERQAKYVQPRPQLQPQSAVKPKVKKPSVIAPEPTMKQKLMRGARAAGEWARKLVTSPVDTLSKTAPVKAIARGTLGLDRVTRDVGDVAASGLQGAGLDRAARATRRATRKSLTGRAIDATKNIKYDSGASSQIGRPSGGRGPKASGLN